MEPRKLCGVSSTPHRLPPPVTPISTSTKYESPWSAHQRASPRVFCRAAEVIGGNSSAPISSLVSSETHEPPPVTQYVAGGLSQRNPLRLPLSSSPKWANNDRNYNLFVGPTMAVVSDPLFPIFAQRTIAKGVGTQDERCHRHHTFGKWGPSSYQKSPQRPLIAAVGRCASGRRMGIRAQPPSHQPTKPSPSSRALVSATTTTAPDFIGTEQSFSTSS